MPQYKPGCYYRPILAGAEDLDWCCRPLLCRLGVHRPHGTTSSAFSKRCRRCPYYWDCR